MIEISNTIFIKEDRIHCCEIFKKDDDCHYVKWFTEDGEFLSDAFTGVVSARNYIKIVSREINKYERLEPESE